MKKIILISILIGLVFVPQLIAQEKDAGNDSPPKWLVDHFTYMTEGTGCWIADNSPFKGENEPFDAYGTEWTWGVGKQSLKGRLFALRDNKEVATFWEFRVFWHPGKRKAFIQQFEAGGAFGVGEMRVIESKDSSINVTEQDFYIPDGTDFLEMHHLVERKGEHETKSFRLEKGSWKLQRTYIWKKVS
jgi:hypothetical protein